MGGKRLLPKPVSRSVVRRPIGGSRQVRSRGKADARGWKTRAPCQAANGRAGLAGNLLPHIARHSKPCSANSLPGTIRHPDQSWLFEPGPCKPRPGKPHPRGGEKNAIRPCEVEPQWQEGAGGLLLVAAAEASGLLSTLGTAVSACTPCGDSRLAHLSARSRLMLVRTLLFLVAVGADGSWEMRNYRGDGLGFLMGIPRAFGSILTE